MTRMQEFYNGASTAEREVVAALLVHGVREITSPISTCRLLMAVGREVCPKGAMHFEFLCGEGFYCRVREYPVEINTARSWTISSRALHDAVMNYPPDQWAAVIRAKEWNGE